MRMTGLMLAGISALALSACSGATTQGLATPGGIVVKAGVEVDQAEKRYAAVAAVADRVLPFLPERQAERLGAFQAAIEQALFLARTAVTVGEQWSALEQAKALTAELDHANATLSLPPPDPG